MFDLGKIISLISEQCLMKDLPNLDLRNVDFVVSSANKCLEGVPGFGYAICRKSKLEKCKGNSRRWEEDSHRS